MNTEKEIRFYFPKLKKNNLIEQIKLKWEYSHSCKEVTTMYDNPNPDFTFYSEKIDGRLRIRNSEQIDDRGIGPNQSSHGSACLVTWKRRLPEKKSNKIREEEEVEININADEAEQVVLIFEHILKCPVVSSYERVRHFFYGKNLQITLDEFPFGLMLEFELKGSGNDATLHKSISEMGLELDQASHLSCDDKYHELCENAGIKPRNNIKFSDSTMPTI